MYNTVIFFFNLQLLLSLTSHRPDAEKALKSTIIDVEGRELNFDQQYNYI